MGVTRRLNNSFQGLNVVLYCQTYWWARNWGVLSEKFPVAYRNPVRPINSNYVLIKLTNCNDDTGLVPFQWVQSNLVLDSHMVSNSERNEPFRVFR